jgi:WD40 repeat protein
VWDTRYMACLHVVEEHLADVYGLAVHPRRPFFLVTSSRDTSLRFWLLDEIVSEVGDERIFYAASVHGQGGGWRRD